MDSGAIFILVMFFLIFPKTAGRHIAEIYLAFRDALAERATQESEAK